MERRGVPIEDYYHRGSFAGEIATSRFDGWRYLAITVFLMLAGLPIGVNFGQRMTGDWLGWGLVIGPIAGALIGGGLTIAGARIPGLVQTSSWLSVFERVFFVVGGMAVWGAMLGGIRGAGREWFPAFTWAVVGFILVGDSLHLPARLRWILAAVRPGLLIAFVGYILQVQVYASLSFVRFGRAIFVPIDAFYTAFPGWADAVQVFVDIVMALMILMGGLFGLTAVSDATFERRGVAKAAGMALFPSLLLGAAGLLLGGIAFWVLTLGRGWSLGAFLTTAGVIAAGLFLFRSQTPLLANGEQFVKARLVQMRKNRPLPGWLERLSFVGVARELTPASIGATALIAAMLEPLFLQILFSAFILLACLGFIAIGIGAVLLVVVFAARQQTATRHP